MVANAGFRPAVLRATLRSIGIAPNALRRVPSGHQNSVCLARKRTSTLSASLYTSSHMPSQLDVCGAATKTAFPSAGTSPTVSSSRFARVDKMWTLDSRFLRLSFAHICRDGFRQDSRAALIASAAQCACCSAWRMMLCLRSLEFFDDMDIVGDRYANATADKRVNHMISPAWK